MSLLSVKSYQFPIHGIDTVWLCMLEVLLDGAGNRSANFCHGPGLALSLPLLPLCRPVGVAGFSLLQSGTPALYPVFKKPDTSMTPCQISLSSLCVTQSSCVTTPRLPGNNFLISVLGFFSSFVSGNRFFPPDFLIIRPFSYIAPHLSASYSGVWKYFLEPGRNNLIYFEKKLIWHNVMCSHWFAFYICIHLFCGLCSTSADAVMKKKWDKDATKVVIKQHAAGHHRHADGQKGGGLK